MKIRCIYNTGEVLMQYHNRPMGMTAEKRFEFLEVGKEYLVMGILFGEGSVKFIIADDDDIHVCRSEFFEIVDSNLPSDWYFKLYTKQDEIYPYREAILGYQELCNDQDHYEKLIDKDPDTLKIYFKRKTNYI